MTCAGRLRVDVTGSSLALSLTRSVFAYDVADRGPPARGMSLAELRCQKRRINSFSYPDMLTWKQHACCVRIIYCWFSKQNSTILIRFAGGFFHDDSPHGELQCLKKRKDRINTKESYWLFKPRRGL